MCIFLTVLIVGCRATSQADQQQPAPRGSPDRLRHLAGVYALTSTTDLALASQAGMQLIIGPQNYRTRPFLVAAEQHRMGVLDSWIQARIYTSYCPGYQPPCRAPSAQQSKALLTDVRHHLEQARGGNIVMGYYLTDDYAGDFAPTLQAVAVLINQIDPQPTACALFLPLTYEVSGRRTKFDRAAFDRSLQNYSPTWCDAVLLYGYGPIRLAPLAGSVDWTMTDVLGPALAALEAAGWDPDTSPLIGVPQAFGFAPRTTTANGSALKTPEYATAPTRWQMSQQIVAFCAAGASSIIGYAWNDGSRGAVSELGNSATLRAGFTDGLKICRSNYWTDR